MLPIVHCWAGSRVLLLLETGGAYDSGMTETGDEIAAGDALYASDPAAWWEVEAAKPMPTPEPAGVPCPECPGGTGLVWTVGRTSLTCPACGHWQTGPSAQRAAEQHAGQR